MLTPTKTIRCIDRQDLAAVCAQLETWLRTPGALRGTYPQVFGADGDAELFGTYVDNQLASHAAARRVRVVTPHGEAHARLVGSVVTAPERRGQGLASDLIREITDRARADGDDAVMLWSDRWAFYERLGFQPAGEQYEVLVEGRPGRLTAGVRAARSGDLPAMLDLHRRKPIAAHRDLRDLALLLSAAPMTTMVLERGGAVVAYACCGKGLDFPDWWHEVGGADGDVAALLQAAMDVLGQAHATVMLPTYRADVVARLGDVTRAENRGVSALCLPVTERGQSSLFVDGLDSI